MHTLTGGSEGRLRCERCLSVTGGSEKRLRLRKLRVCTRRFSMRTLRVCTRRFLILTRLVTVWGGIAHRIRRSRTYEKPEVGETTASLRSPAECWRAQAECS